MGGFERKVEQERREALWTRAKPNPVNDIAASLAGSFDIGTIRPGSGHKQPTRNAAGIARFWASAVLVSLGFHAAALIAMLIWPHSPPVTPPPEATPVEIVMEEPPPPKPDVAELAQTPPLPVEPPPVVEAASPPAPPPAAEPPPSPAEPPAIPETAAQPEPSPPALAAPPPPPVPAEQPELVPPPIAIPQRPPIPAPSPVRPVESTPQPARARTQPRNVPARAPPPAEPREPRPTKPAPVATSAAGPAASGAEQAEYQRALIARISAVKRYPEAARERAPHGVAVVSFSINASGQVAGVSITQSAGDPILDAEALATVRRASPFPPPPPGAPRTFSAPLSFRVR
jgi:protein TonB